MIAMLNEIYEQPKLFTNTIKKNKAAIFDFVKKIGKRKINTIIIAARGTSDNAGFFAKYLIECKLGIPVSFAAPSVITKYGSCINYEDCLVIGISQSGEASDVIEVIKAAKNSSGLTLSITNEASSLSLESEYNIFLNAGTEKSIAATKTFMCQTALISYLVAIWSNDVNFNNDLLLVPKRLKTILDNISFIDKIVEDFNFSKKTFVLSRGVSYPLALETALKIQETNYENTQAFAVSDFHHGPMAMLDSETNIILFAPESPFINNFKEIINKIRASGSKLLVISNIQSICDLGDLYFKIPYSDSDIVSFFYNLIFSQVFSCKLALKNGINPDFARNLKKVTQTL